GRYGCLETVASLSALKKQARVWLKSQPVNTQLDPEKLTTAQLIAAWQSGEPWITSWVDRSANAIGLSLYNFLNILNTGGRHVQAQRPVTFRRNQPCTAT
ncbi:hypothetical protein ACUOCP_48830, partial [Escherichia sp. R-CC3]